MFLFLGLEEVEESGSSLCKKYIPCPTCIAEYQHKQDLDCPTNSTLVESCNTYFRNPDCIKQFDLQICAFAALNYDSIYCDKHPDQSVQLRVLVPELLLSDLPSSFRINRNEFEFHPSKETQLGEGGAGGVYRGRYKGQDVAVKQFHSASKM